MTDTSKAKWPDGMEARRNTSAVFIDNAEHWYVQTPKEILLGVTAQYGNAESRARQICALPKMVALLKELAEGKLWLKTPSCTSVTDLPTPTAQKAQAILREIGEFE